MNESPQTRPLAITTGTGGNLGKGVVSALLAAEYNVLGTMRYHKHVPELESLPGFTRGILDVLDESACREFVVSLKRQVHMTVLMVGGFQMGGIRETTWEQLQRMVQMNFQSCFFLAQSFLEKMKQQVNGGHIVLIGATPALDPINGRFAWAYTLSKSLVHNFAAMLDAEGKEHGVRTHLIVPGIIDTPVNRQAMPDADFSTWTKPEAIGKIIAFLGTKEGQVLRETVLKV
ncbi:MAG: SDR family NAD(P)-dependent oxidoreductase [Bacteroidota bacterium]